MYERIVYPIMAAMTIVGVILGVCDLEPSGPVFQSSKKRCKGRRSSETMHEANADAVESEAAAW